MSRSVSELKRAASAQGWDGDPLSTEILQKMEELDAAASKANIPPPAPVVEPFNKRVVVILAVATAASLAALATVIVWSSSTSKRHELELAQVRTATEAQIAQKTQEIEWLKKAHAEGLVAAAAKIESALAAADSASRNNANITDSIVKVLMAEARNSREGAPVDQSAKPSLPSSNPDPEHPKTP